MNIALVTCDRVDWFDKSLKSIIEELGRVERSCPVLVFDDSRGEEIRRQKKQIASSLGADRAKDIIYIGLEEKHEFIKTWGRQKEEEELLHSALFGMPETDGISGAGGNRNAVTLFNAGTRIVTMDDDTECRFFSLSAGETGIDLGMEGPRFENGSFSEEKPLRKKITPFVGDPFLEFDTLLGRTVKEAAEFFRNEGKTVHEQPENRKAGRMTISAAMAGIYGGRWFSRPFGIYFTEGTLRKDTLRNRKAYEQAKLNPYVYFQSPGYSVTSDPLLVTTMAGMDLSKMTPPFLPGNRNDDNLWGILLRYCYPDSVTLHFPFTVYHDRSGKKPFLPGDFLDTSCDLGLLSVLIFSDLGKRLFPLTAKETILRLGTLFRDLGRLSREDWTEYCRDLWLTHAGRTVLKLEVLLERYRGKPSFWAADVKQFTSLLKKQAEDPSSWVPRELRARVSWEEAGRLNRGIYRRYGELLGAWPELWETARRLNEERFGA